MKFLIQIAAQLLRSSLDLDSSGWFDECVVLGLITYGTKLQQARRGLVAVPY